MVITEMDKGKVQGARCKTLEARHKTQYKTQDAISKLCSVKFYVLSLVCVHLN